MTRADLIPLDPVLVQAALGEPAARTSRGFAILGDGELLGIAGFYLDKTRWILFSDLTAKGVEVRRQVVGRRAAALTVRRLREILPTLRAPVHAVVDEDYPEAHDMLMRLGFRSIVGEEVYAWRG